MRVPRFTIRQTVSGLLAVAYPLGIAFCGLWLYRLRVGEGPIVAWWMNVVSVLVIVHSVLTGVALIRLRAEITHGR